MAIFRRKGKDSPTDEPVEQNDVVQTESIDGDETDPETEEITDTADSVSDDVQESAEASTAGRPNSRDVDRSSGPFDRSEVDNLDGRIDFGSLAITPILEMELRLDLDEAGQEITGLTAIVGESACQMQVFAAPKTRGVWDAIRGEIHDNLLTSGGTAEEKVGDLGTELHVRMPAKGPDGRTTYSPAAFIGVDGPRWFLRAVLSGKAAMEPEAYASMLELVKATVVTRGGEPRAPREMLPLRLPEDSTPTQSEAEVDSDETTHSVPDPFERGPEITEVR